MLANMRYIKKYIIGLYHEGIIQEINPLKKYITNYYKNLFGAWVDSFLKNLKLVIFHKF
jgi:hypothetical protein